MTQKLKDSLARMCDTVLDGKDPEVAIHSRRVWLQNFAAVSATSAVLWSCGKSDDNKAVAASGDYSVADKKTDANTMNGALALEYEAIGLYSAAADLPVWGVDASALAPSFLAVAKQFLAHHQAHASKLVAEIKDISKDTGIDPVTAKDKAEYLKPYPTIGDLKGASGLLVVLQVAAEREMNAANAYYGAISLFKNTKLMQALGGLSSDESGHFGVLNAAAFAHAFLTKDTSSKLDDTNLVPGALPTYKYARTDLRS